MSDYVWFKSLWIRRYLLTIFTNLWPLPPSNCQCHLWTTPKIVIKRTFFDQKTFCKNAPLWIQKGVGIPTHLVVPHTTTQIGFSTQIWQKIDPKNVIIKSFFNQTIFCKNEPLWTEKRWEIPTQWVVPGTTTQIGFNTQIWGRIDFKNVIKNRFF